MLKNSTKITSLLVAAASMATMVPAMAADTTKIADEDGKIYRAISYADGKVYVEGEDIEAAKDEDGAFFIDGGKSKEVDDLGSDDEITAVYGTKYVEIAEGDYYVDLTNGKVTDDQLRNEAKEDAASDLAKKLRKQDPGRYTEKSSNEKANIEMDDIKNDADEIWEVPAAPYTEPYYQVNYLRFNGDSDKGQHVYAGEYNTGAADDDGNVKIPTVYTDGKGTYVDADNDLGNVNVIINKNIDASTTTAEAIIIDPDASVSKAEAIKFDAVDTKKNKDKTAEVTVDVEHIATLTSDKDYVYRLAALHVKFKNLKSGEVYDITDEGQVMMFGSTKNPVAVKSSEKGRFYVIQKISKETDGDKDDANLPKTTQTYFVSENKDWRKKGEVERDADKKVTGFNADMDGVISTNPDNDDRTIWINDKDYYDEDTTNAAVFMEKFANREENTVAYTVVDGRISKYEPQFQTLNDNGSAKDDNNEDDNFVIKTFILKNSNGFYYVDKEKNDDSFEEEDEFATAIDKDGNIWKLDSGKIKKYKNDGSYETVYKCDGGLNELSVYDEKNLIAYNEDDDTYAIVGGKSSTGNYTVDTEDSASATTTAQVGWYTNADGSWSYGNADGTRAIGWLQSPTSGLWYYMDANGVMMTNGWVQDGAYWYFLGADGAMKTGWVYTGGAWYYLKPTAGNMGAMQTGWIQTGGKWYYCNASGAMLSNTTVNGYKLGADGAWIK